MCWIGNSRRNNCHSKRSPTYLNHLKPQQSFLSQGYLSPSIENIARMCWLAHKRSIYRHLNRSSTSLILLKPRITYLSQGPLSPRLGGASASSSTEGASSSSAPPPMHPPPPLPPAAVLASPDRPVGERLFERQVRICFFLLKISQRVTVDLSIHREVVGLVKHWKGGENLEKVFVPSHPRLCWLVPKDP